MAHHVVKSSRVSLLVRQLEVLGIASADLLSTRTGACGKKIPPSNWKGGNTCVSCTVFGPSGGLAAAQVAHQTHAQQTKTGGARNGNYRRGQG